MPHDSRRSATPGRRAGHSGSVGVRLAPLGRSDGELLGILAGVLSGSQQTQPQCGYRRGVLGHLPFGLRRLSTRRLAALFVVAVSAAAGVLAASSEPALAQPGGFDDVAEDAYYSVPVSTLAERGVFSGTECEAGFCPGDPIDRKTMAVWMVRILDGEEPTPVSEPRFDDVVAASFHAPFIERMADLEVTEGCGDGSRFCPDDNVNRGQMAAFISRAFNLPDGPDPGFADVAADVWFAAAVARLAASQITAGCGDGTRFCPDGDTTRGQMATFLARALGLVEAPTAEDPRDGQSSRPTAFTAVSVGVSRACGLQADGTITCWGGNNPYGHYDPPRGSFSAVTVGGYKSYHSCGLRTDGTITCWGGNSYGQTDAPQGSFSAISAGRMHSCGLRTDGTITCWGGNSYGQTDAPQGSFSAISAGAVHSCGLRTDGTITCWGGYDPYGRDYAVRAHFNAVNAGSNDDSCGLRTDGTITCWSPNGVRFPPQGSFAAVSVGHDHRFCGVRTDGKLICWRNHSTAREAPEGSFTAVAVGGDQSCGVRTDGTITCWGHPYVGGRYTYAFTRFDPSILKIDGVEDSINLQVTYDEEAYEATVRWQAPSGTHGQVDHYVLQSRTILEDFGGPEFYQIVEAESGRTSYRKTASNSTNSNRLYAFRVITVYANGKRLATSEVKTPANVHKLRDIIWERVVEPNQDDQPWLGDTWIHMNDSTRFGMGLGRGMVTLKGEYPDPNGLERTFARSLVWGDLFFKTKPPPTLQ